MRRATGHSKKYSEEKREIEEGDVRREHWTAPVWISESCNYLEKDLFQVFWGKLRISLSHPNSVPPLKHPV